MKTHCVKLDEKTLELLKEIALELSGGENLSLGIRLAARIARDKIKLETEGE